jgi:hypothetical protein
MRLVLTPRFMLGAVPQMISEAEYTQVCAPATSSKWTSPTPTLSTLPRFEYAILFEHNFGRSARG